MIRKLTAIDPESLRALYKVVRTDTMEDLPGLIMFASPSCGICVMQHGNGTREEYNFGANGIVIVER